MPKYKKAVRTKLIKEGKVLWETKLEDVEYPSDKFFLTTPRYIDGVYVPATPDAPATVTLPPGFKVDDGLLPADGPLEKLKPHYAEKAPHPHGPVSAASAHGPKHAEEKEAPKGKRANDKDAL